MNAYLILIKKLPKGNPIVLIKYTSSETLNVI